MAILTNTAEGGTNTTSVTTGNSGGASGDAFNQISKNTNSLTFTSAASAHGQFSYLFGLTSGGTSSVIWSGFSTTQVATRFYFKIDGTANPLLRLWEVRDTVGFSVARILLNSTNKLLLQTNDGSTTVKTFTSTINTNTWYRVEVATSTGTSNATLKISYYLGDSISPVEADYISTTANTGTTNNLVDTWTGSGASASLLVGNLWMDNLSLQTGSLSFLGPSGSGTGAAAWVAG